MSLIPAVRAVEFRLRAFRNDAPTDLTGFLTRARVGLGDVSTVGTGASGGDGLSMTGDFTLINDRPGNDPLQPGARNSRFNQPNPLLSPNRRIMLDVRATPEGQAFGTWTTIFDGLLNAAKLQGNGSRVNVRAQDWAKVLQRKMIPGDKVYGTEGGQRLDVTIQQLINDHIPNAPIVRVVGTPEFWVEPYTPAFGSVWDTIQQLVTQAGWYFGMRRGIGGSFALTLMDPPRGKTTPDWLFTGDDVITADIDRDDIDVRNAFLIRYVDGVTREPTQYPLAGPHVNQASVDALGGVEQLMIIELGDTSQIDTAGEAQALLARAEHDLSSMFEATQVELPIMPELNLFDMVGIDVAAVGNQQLFAVNSLEHTIDVPARGGTARYRTTISGTSRVVGKYRDWIDLEVRPGSPNDKPGPHQTRLLAPRVSLLPGQPGFIVAVEAGPASRGVGAVGVEVHWSTTNGFNPGPSTVRAAGPEERFSFAPNSNATHYVRVRTYDERERYGPYSPQLSIVPARVDGRWLVLDQNVNVTGDFRVGGSTVELNADTTVAGSFTVGGPSGNVAINDGAITTDKLAAGEIDISRNDRATGRLNAKDTSNNTQAAFGDITDLPGVPNLGPTRKYGMWVRRGTGLIIPGEYYEANTYYYNHVFTATTELSSGTDYIELAPGGDYTGHPGIASEPPNAWVRVSCVTPSYYPDPPSRPAGAWRFGILGVRIQYRTRQTSSSAWGSWTQYVGPFETLAAHQSELRVRVPIQYVGDTVPASRLRVRTMVNILIERAYKE